MSRIINVGYQPLPLRSGQSAADADRSQDLRSVITTIVAALAEGAEERGLHAVFEEEVRWLLLMRSVRLREIPARYQARLVTPTRTADSIVLGVRSADPATQAVLEASFDPEHASGGAECEVLVAVAQLGAWCSRPGAHARRRRLRNLTVRRRSSGRRRPCINSALRSGVSP